MKSKLLALSLCLVLCLVALTGCSASSGSSSSGDGGIITVYSSPDQVAVDDSELTPLAAATNFSFDFESMEYSFDSVENADYYYIRVYPVTDGVEANSASFQSAKISATQGTVTGTVEDESLLAGDYIAYVLAYGSGYSSSEATTTGASTMMATCSVSATFNTDEETQEVTITVAVTPGDSVVETFTVTVTDGEGNQVYSNAAVTAEGVVLAAEDLGVDSITVEDTYEVTAAVNQVAGYTAPTEVATATAAEAMMMMWF